MDLVKLTVNLTHKNSQAMHRASEMSGDSPTDVVNRALAFYAFLYEHVFLHNRELLVRDPKTRKIEKVNVDAFPDDRTPA